MSEWQSKSLGEVVRIVRGISYKSSEINDEGVGRPFLNLKSVGRGGGYRSEGLKYFTGRVREDQSVGPGDLLIANTDLTRDKAILGCPILLPDQADLAEACFSLDLARLVVDAEVLDRRFLALVLQADDSRDFMKTHSSGTTVIHLKIPDVPRLLVPVPPLIEQRRIVDLVGALDAKIETLDATRQALVSLLGAVRVALVETVTWKPLLTFAAPGGVQIGPFGSQLHAHEYVDQGVPVVMPQDIVDGEIRSDKIKCVSEQTAARLKRHWLLPGDLVLPRRGDLTKRALVLESQEGWLCGTGSIRIRLADPSLGPALMEGLSTPTTDDWLTTNAVGTTMLNLNTEIVSKIPAPVFTNESRGLAHSCLVARGVLKIVDAEAGELGALRSCLLAHLLSGDVEIPDAYDALLTEAV